MHTVYSIQISHILPVILCGVNFYSVPSSTNNIFASVLLFEANMLLTVFSPPTRLFKDVTHTHILPVVLLDVTHAHYTA